MAGIWKPKIGFLTNVPKARTFIETNGITPSNPIEFLRLEQCCSILMVQSEYSVFIQLAAIKQLKSISSLFAE